MTRATKFHHLHRLRRLHAAQPDPKRPGGQRPPRATAPNRLWESCLPRGAEKRLAKERKEREGEGTLRKSPLLAAFFGPAETGAGRQQLPIPGSTFRPPTPAPCTRLLRPEPQGGQPRLRLPRWSN
eukprot:COSAG04_NODE_384_length_15390_cov_64.570158_9_plen_126_part_00